MAVSRLETYGMLDRWRSEMDVNIWHFNQLTGQGSNAPLNVPGQFVYVQPERDRIAEGLVKALGLAVPRLGFFPRPSYVTDTVRLTNKRALRWQEVVMPKRYIDAIGKRGVTVIEADAAVVYTDPFAEGVDTLATITVTLPAEVTDPAEVQVFFRQADSLALEQADEAWRIDPVEVTIVGTTATITGHRALFAKPSLWARPYDGSFGQPSKVHGDVQSPASFVTEVDVVRIYPDATGAVVIKCRTACCSSTGFDTYSGGGAYVIDSEAGVVGLTADGCTCGSRHGLYLELHYRAGLPEGGFESAVVAQALVHLANAKMVTPVGPDDAGNNRWYNDKLVVPRNDLSEAERNNPFGGEWGSIQAYNLLKSYMRTSMRAAI